MRKETTIRGINLVYEDLGAGPVILLIHGQPFNRTMWNDQKTLFSKTHRLIIPDLRSYGESEITEGLVLLDELALDLIHLLDRLEIGKAIVVGLSMGGQIALELYCLKPALFKGIVLADTEARAEDEKSYQHRLALAAQLLKDGMEKFTDDRIEHFMCPATFETKPQVVARVAHMMKTTSAAGSAAVQRGRAERLDYTPLLGKIDFPALIIVGDQDEFTPLASAAYMHERIANSTLAIIANSGHISNMEQPAAFNRNLQNFLSRF